MDGSSVRRLAHALLVLARVAVFVCVASAPVGLSARGVLGDAHGHRRRRRAIDRLRDHTITCGYGRAGRRVPAELAPLEKPVAR